MKTDRRPDPSFTLDDEISNSFYPPIFLPIVSNIEKSVFNTMIDQPLTLLRDAKTLNYVSKVTPGNKTNVSVNTKYRANKSP